MFFFFSFFTYWLLLILLFYIYNFKNWKKNIRYYVYYYLLLKKKIYYYCNVIQNTPCFKIIVRQSCVLCGKWVSLDWVPQRGEDRKWFFFGSKSWFITVFSSQEVEYWKIFSLPLFISLFKNSEKWCNIVKQEILSVSRRRSTEMSRLKERGFGLAQIKLQRRSFQRENRFRES